MMETERTNMHCEFNTIFTEATMQLLPEFLLCFANMQLKNAYLWTIVIGRPLQITDLLAEVEVTGSSSM